MIYTNISSSFTINKNISTYYDRKTKKKIEVSDTTLCDFVGLDTYRALYNLAPTLYAITTYPMTSNEYDMSEIRNMFTLGNGIDNMQIKYLLVHRFIKGKSDKTALIEKLVHSSEVMIYANMSPSTSLYYIIYTFVVLYFIFYVTYFYITPYFQPVRHQLCDSMSICF